MVYEIASFFLFFCDAGHDVSVAFLPLFHFRLSGIKSLWYVQLNIVPFFARYPKHALPGAFFEDERVKSMPITQLAEHLCAIVRSTNVPSVGLDEGSTHNIRKTLLDRKLNILCLHGFRLLALFVFRFSFSFCY
jgi:hypothetical protein